jgi:hypothetical protein
MAAIQAIQDHPNDHQLPRLRGDIPAQWPTPLVLSRL